MVDPATAVHSSSSSFFQFLASRRLPPPPSHRQSQRRSLLRLRAQARKDDPEDLYGPYPWDQHSDVAPGSDIQWVPEDKSHTFYFRRAYSNRGLPNSSRVPVPEGLDTGRRLCIFGFCQSVEMLSNVVEDTVLEHSSEVVSAEKASNGGLQEKLTMSVAVPWLWGVPPASEKLHVVIRSGGGIVEKMYWQRDFF